MLIQTVPAVKNDKNIFVDIGNQMRIRAFKAWKELPHIKNPALKSAVQNILKQINSAESVNQNAAQSCA